MYEAQADTINVDDIATDSNNRIVMRRLKRNVNDDEITDPDQRKSLCIQNEHDKDGEEC